MLSTPRDLLVGLSLSLLAGPGVGAAPRSGPPQEGPARAGEETLETRSFSIQDTRAVRALFDSASAHVAARRWSSAIQDLQQILKEHKSGVLAGERLPRGDGRIGDQPTHAGAAQRARAKLFELPQEARQLYRERYEREASQALSRARERSDRRALAEVARRWPLCDAAERAWWSLGDLEHEQGHVAEACQAWGRALAQRLGEPGLQLDGAEAWTRARDRWARRKTEPALEDVAVPSAPGDPQESAGGDRTGALGEGASIPRDSAGAARRDAGIARRIEIALDGHRRAPRLGSQLSSSLWPSTPATGGGPPPGRGYDAWTRPFALPDHPFKGRPNFFPARSGDVLLISTSLRLLALQAYSGELLWDSGEPAGWSTLSGDGRDGFFKGLDHEAALISPAASEHVALAALQVPLAFVPNDSFQTIPITTILPDRRLFAFDLASGARLWDHAPPSDWDGESGGFTRRMSVAGPPLVVGTRVLVPFCRMQGRIDYHVGCVDVATGELLWSTDVVSGQRELNMFGRLEKEFCAAPLVVAGDRVIALTQLGTVAALDLYSGEVLWETLYPQLPLPRNRDYRAPERRKVWRNAPPIVVGRTIVAAPVDSEELVGLDLDTGALLWNVANGPALLRPYSTRESRFDLLLGANESTVWLGGTRLIALEAQAGLRAQAPTRAKWPIPFEHDDLKLPGARPVLGRDRIVVPGNGQRIEVDLEQGRRIEAIDWAGGQSAGGNLLLGSGELFTVSRTQANGYFEWEALVARARSESEANASDVRRALALGKLLSKRGASEWQRGDSEAARSHLAEARGVLERALGPRSAAGADPALARELHQVLRSEARVRTSLADGAGALRALRQAAAWAPDRGALRDTLIEELVLLRAPQAPGSAEAAAAETEIGAVLAELERTCSDLPLVCQLELAAELDQGLGVLPRLRPEVTADLAKSDAVPCELPVGLWVRIERARGATGPSEELAELQAILADFAEVEIPGGRAGGIAGARIGAVLAAAPEASSAAYEEGARAALEEALSRRDREALRRVPELHPFSRAARAANDALLEWATASGSAVEVARIVQSELAADWRLSEASERELRLCLHLASVLGKAGNRELERELVRSLAERHPDFVSDLPEHAGARLADLAGPRWSPPLDPPPGGRFDASARRAAYWDGDHRVVGWTSPAEGDLAPRELVVLQSRPRDRQVRIFTLSPGSLEEKSAEASIAVPYPPSSGDVSAWSARVALAAGRVLLASHDTVLAHDARSLARAWSWRVPGGALESIALTSASGVLVVVAHHGGGRYAIHALDAQAGHELWSEDMQEVGLRPMPLCSSNQLVFVPNSGRRQFLVRDLFTGRRALSFELDSPVPAMVDQEAWIEDDRLIVPWFTSGTQKSQMVAIDLATGRRVWRISFSELGPEPLILENVIRSGARTWLIAGPWPSADRPATRTLFELATGIGAVAPLAHIRIGGDDKILGIPRSQRRLKLASPHLYVISKSSKSEEARLRAIDLEGGELWAQGLQVRFEEISGLSLPVPAMSESTVAIAYTLLPRRDLSRGQQTTSLVFFDRERGVKGETRDLPDVHGKSDALKMWTLGDALVIQGEKRLEVLR